MLIFHRPSNSYYRIFLRSARREASVLRTEAVIICCVCVKLSRTPRRRYIRQAAGSIRERAERASLSLAPTLKPRQTLDSREREIQGTPRAAKPGSSFVYSSFTPEMSNSPCDLVIEYRTMTILRAVGICAFRCPS